MWWNEELNQRRHETMRARRRLAASANGDGPEFEEGQPSALRRTSLTSADGLALAFAVASILGPWRAVRIALAVVSAVRTVRMLTSSGPRR